METFGFHLAELEIRQHSELHEKALAELDGEHSEMTDEILETLRVVAWIQGRFGVRACHRYVISFTRSAEDIANVHALAASLGDGAPVLDVVPLFETGEDLQHAPAVLDGMLEIPAVQRRLDDTGRRLEVMLGYSDSAKQLGPASATLLLYDTQEALAAWAARHDIKLTLFHGRGGSLGRGGARPTARSSRRPPARSRAGSRSPSRARSSSPATASARSPAAMSSRSPAPSCWPRPMPSRTAPARPPTASAPRRQDRRSGEDGVPRAHRDRGLRRLVRPGQPA